MPKIKIIKHDGSRQLFDPSKVLRSIQRSEVSEKDAKKILKQVEGRLFNGITTKEIYQIVHREIVRLGLPQGPYFYRLREALAAMDPIDFEKFIQMILVQEGFKAEWDLIVPGFCIEHQIDVIAENKKKQVYYVEVKHHRNFHRDTDLGTVVEVWGRFDDLRLGFKNKLHDYDFICPWLVTNTKFSGHAKKYAECKKMGLTGWRYDLDETGRSRKDRGLENLFKQLGSENIKQLVRRVIDGL